MKTAVFGVACYLLICFHSFAQAPFLQGTIVSVTNDTTYGYLEQETTDKLTQKLRFKPTLNDLPQTFEPRQLKGFAFTGGSLFESIFLSGPHNLNGNIFAKVLNQGILKVYSVPEGERLRILIVAEDGKQHLLEGDKVTTMGELETRGNYRNKLGFLLRTQPELQKRVERISFNEKAITNLINRYNQAVAPGQYSVHHQTPNTNYRFWGMAGGMYLNNRQNEWHIQLQSRMVMPELSRRTALIAGIGYTQYKSYESGRDFLNRMVVTPISLSYINIPLALQYNLLEGILQPFVLAGGTIGIGKGNPEKGLYRPNPDKPLTPFTLLLAAGLEYYPTANLMVRADYRFEYEQRHPSVTIGYRLKKLRSKGGK